MTEHSIRMVWNSIAISLWVSLSGCAARVFPVALNTPPPIQTKAAVTVVDARLDKQLSITAIGWDSSVGVFFLAPAPPLDDVLTRRVTEALRGKINALSQGPVTLTLEDLELRNRVGFAKVDHITCRLVSNLSVGGKSVRVQTLSTNTSNMSPYMPQAAKVVLDQCLEEHAGEAVLQLVRSGQH